MAWEQIYDHLPVPPSLCPLPTTQQDPLLQINKAWFDIVHKQNEKTWVERQTIVPAIVTPLESSTHKDGVFKHLLTNSMHGP